jgi:hypothetical protein
MSSSSSSSATSVSYSHPLVNPVPIGGKYNLGMQIINTANPPFNGDDVESGKRKGSMKMCVVASLLVWLRCSSAHILSSQILVFKTVYILRVYILSTHFYGYSSPISSHHSFAWYIRRLFSTRHT